jgi:hypothetical protein
MDTAPQEPADGAAPSAASIKEPAYEMGRQDVNAATAEMGFRRSATLEALATSREFEAAVDSVFSLIERQAAEIAALRKVAATLPKVAPPGLLMSMAIRFDHGLACPGYYDALRSLCSVGEPSHAKRLESTLTIMRQLYEEVSGYGFYKPEHEDKYAALQPTASPQEPK